MQNVAVTLELTGERTLPGIPHENYWLRRHEAAYRFAAARCGGLDVLDAGCGEGYGTALLAAVARRAVGVELVAEVAVHAQRTYPRAAFVQAEVGALPLASASFDAVVSLQVVEHLWDIPRYVGQIARVLRPGGWFCCATPNRLTFTPGRDTPANPFHTVEFSPAELARVLATRFARVQLAGVFHGPRLARAERERGTSVAQLQAASAPECWPGWLHDVVRGVTAADFTVARTGLDASLDLLAFASGPRSRGRAGP